MTRRKRTRQGGFVISLDAVLVITILGAGLMVGMAALISAVTAELGDLQQMLSAFVTGAQPPAITIDLDQPPPAWTTSYPGPTAEPAPPDPNTGVILFAATTE